MVSVEASEGTIVAAAGLGVGILEGYEGMALETFSEVLAAFWASLEAELDILSIPLLTISFTILDFDEIEKSKYP